MKQSINQIAVPLDNTAESPRSGADSVIYQQQPDTSLMQQYAAGDILAFETLYNRHKGGLHRYFIRHIAEQSLAEDLYQDIWNKVILRAHSYSPTAKFTTWLYTLAHNKLVDHVRHLSVINKIEVGSHDSGTNVADSDEHHENLVDSDLNNSAEKQINSARVAENLKHCIGRLPQAQKDSFLLKEEAGLSVKDIAAVLNTSFEASKSRLRYAYKNLRQCLQTKTGRAI